MKQILPLLIALVLAVVVFMMNDAGAVEACGSAVVTFVIVLFVGWLIVRPKRRKEE